MALSRTNLKGEGSADNHGTGAFTTSSFTPPDNSLLVVMGGAMDKIGSVGLDTALTMAGGSLTFTRQINVEAGGGSAFSIASVIWTAPVTTGASMTLSLDAGARNLQIAAISAVAYTGYDTGTPVNGTGTVVDTASPDGAQSITLSAAPTTSDEVFAGMTLDKEDAGVTPGATYSEIHDIQISGTGGIETEIRTGSTSTTADWVDTWPGGGNIFKISAVALVVKAGAAAAVASTDPAVLLNPLTQLPYALADQAPWEVRAFAPPIPLEWWPNTNTTDAYVLPATVAAATALPAATNIISVDAFTATAITGTTSVSVPVVVADNSYAGDLLQSPVTQVPFAVGSLAPWELRDFQPPIPLEWWPNLPPGVAAAVDATIVAVAIAGVTDVSAGVTVQTGSTVTATAVAGTVSAPAPTVQTGETVVATAIVGTTALPAATVQTGSTVTPSVVATVTDLPAPTVSTGSNATATPSVIATVTALPAPTVQTGSTVTPAVIATVTVLPAPTVSGGSNATPAPAVIATVTALPAPTVKTDSTVSAAALAVVVAFPSPSVSGNVASGITGNLYPRVARTVGGSAHPGSGSIIGEVG